VCLACDPGRGSKGRGVRRSEVPVPVLAALNSDKQERGQQVVILVQVCAETSCSEQPCTIGGCRGQVAKGSG
jgi:hypothetical protein